ncbi:MAG: outer-membrane lipoprotein carrier protein LolA [Ignavibacteriaceae bacterium]|nr:outer-membrane lipoprotein carrier protein LolA [Ignavibacteriaceae bacterium]
MKKILILTFLILANIFPQGKDVPLLKAMQNKFSSLHDFSVDFSQEVNGKILMTGKLSFNKGNMLHLEMKNLMIVSNGVTNWNYNKKEKKVIVSNFSEEDASLFSPKKFVFDYPNQCKVTEVMEDGKTYLLLIPASSSSDFKQAKVYPTENQTLRQVVVTGNDGKVITFHFSNFRGNQNFDKEKFSFQIPQGTKIIDLR